MRVVVINAPWLIDDYLFGLVIRHVNYFFIGRCDLDNAIVVGDGLAFVGFEITGSISAIAKRFDSRQNVRLLVDNGFAEPPGPVDFLVHHVDDFGIVQQCDHRLVPGLIRLERAVLSEFVEETRRLHDFQRIGRRRQDNCQQIVWIQCDRTNQVLEFGKIKGLRRLLGRLHIVEGIERP